MIVALRHGEPIQNHLRRSIRDVVAVGIRNEKQLRRRHQPDAAFAHLDTGQLLDMIDEDLPRLRASVVILVFQDDHAVAQPEIEPLGRLGVGVILRDPQPAAMIPGEADRDSESSGSAAKRVALNPSGIRIFDRASAGEMGEGFPGSLL